MNWSHTCIQDIDRLVGDKDIDKVMVHVEGIERRGSEHPGDVELEHNPV